MTAGPPGAAAPASSVFAIQPMTHDLDRYLAFGVKRSGGAGDQACGAWLEGELKTAGLRVERQVFEAPYFEADTATLEAGGARAAVIPQPIVSPTGPGGLAGPLAVRAPWTTPETRCDDAIALVVLPYRRWSTATAPDVKGPALAAFAAGAAAVILVTTGPTGEAIALNAPAEPLFPGPVAILAPKDAAPFLAAGQRGERGRLTVAGHGGRRPAFNLVGRLERGAGRPLVVSTPRSGWFGCAGERGGGVAAWLALLRWAPAALPRHDLVFLCTSGHEYENLGSGGFLAAAAPPPSETALWLHLGANVAARDWNALAALTPLPGADSQRILMVTEDLAGVAAEAFRGQPGLERPFIAHPGRSAGELTGILAKGYPRVAGVFGSHRFHHVASDDARCFAPEATLAAAVGFRELVARALA
ncbi:MAG TPA: hypothetical protein VLI41_01685 [Phenylobacterium sp.]|uniref:hypothetical protein n=1 Tax=Phenylobacterium sp. TaxID=1871053 RepID=UPI002B662180|nr:hypothetical protein [Phenylobacterium sp.]HSV01890.1 hypothetical protein [Phenylobacterium sp.]